MKSVMSAAVVLSALAVSGATYRTNNVEGLVYLLKTYSRGGHTVELEAGDYCLRDDLTWYTNSSCHVSYLYADKVHIKGLGEKPEDTRLIGGGSFRVIEANGSSVLENLTVTNGYAAVVDNCGNSGRGGGIYGGVTVTNCLVTCNYAATYGGGGAGYVRFEDSRIINNEAAKSGGGFHGSYAKRSRITGNVAQNNGGGIYTAYELCDCEVISNRTVSSHAGGGYNVIYATNCVFAFNHSGSSAGYGGGGVANGGGEDVSLNKLYDCTIVSNTSAYHAGGAYRVTVIGGKIIGNTARASGGASTCTILDGCHIAFNSATNGNGGGVYNSTISNCTVYANICSNLTSTAYGGGVNECTVYDSEIAGNYSKSCIGTDGVNKVGSAGGVYKSTLYGCNIHDNYSDSYGGGVRESVLYGCRLESNCAGNDGMNAYISRLTDCDVVGTGVYNCNAERTVFREIMSTASASGNPYNNETRNQSYLVKGTVSATNCLFCCNDVYHIYQYFSTTPSSGSFVNCTVVSNVYNDLLSNFGNGFSFVVENSIFYGNKAINGMDADISLPDLSGIEGSLIFRNCAYGTYSASGGIDMYIQGPMYVFGMDGFPSDPKFMGGKDTEHPFSLRRTSPLIGKGAYASWMDGAYDIRGEGYPRANGTSVDLGCYQCWLNPIGTVFSIR